jgi:hypothetical protein
VSTLQTTVNATVELVFFFVLLFGVLWIDVKHNPVTRQLATFAAISVSVFYCLLEIGLTWPITMAPIIHSYMFLFASSMVLTIVINTKVSDISLHRKIWARIIGLFFIPVVVYFFAHDFHAFHEAERLWHVNIRRPTTGKARRHTTTFGPGYIVYYYMDEHSVVHEYTPDESGPWIYHGHDSRINTRTQVLETRTPFGWNRFGGPRAFKDMWR